MGGCGACTAEDRRYTDGRTTSWAQTVVFSRTWQSGTHGTTRTITWYWGASAAPCLPHTRTIYGNAYVSPSICRLPWTGSTACLLSFGIPLTSHLIGTPLTGMDIPRNLVPHRRQDCGTPERVSLDYRGYQPLDKGKPPRGPALENGKGRVSGGVSPRLRSASHSRGVDLDVRVL